MTFSWAELRGYYPGDWVRPRANDGAWRPLVDWTEVFCGHRGIDRQGAFELYDAPVGVRLAIEAASKRGPIEFDGPVEDLSNSVHLRHKEGRYHLLYYQSGKVAYAHSEDGMRWQRPSLGLVEHRGSRDNNLVSDVGGDLLKAVFEDPAAPPEKRFRGMGCEGAIVNADTWEVANEGEAVTGDEVERWWADQEYLGPAYDGPRLELKGRVIGWSSPDGIRWTRDPGALADFPMDGGLSVRHDPHSGFYYAFCRVQGVAQEQFELLGTGAPEAEIHHRAIGLSRTRDPSRWPAPKLVLLPDGQDPPDVSFYGGDHFPYPGREDLHGMFVQVYHHVTDHVDSQVAFSRDGLLWQRPERRAIIPVGGPGAADEAMVYSWGSGVVTLPDGDWGSLYGGFRSLHNDTRGDHTAALMWATWRPHRLCGVEADAEGRCTIPTVARSHAELRLNYRCQPGGWIRAEVIRQIPSRVHPDVDPVDGFSFEGCDPLTGDEVDRVVTWGGRSDLSAAGEMLAVRLRLFRAKLFAYRV
jgi:hypothetical protein